MDISKAASSVTSADIEQENCALHDENIQTLKTQQNKDVEYVAQILNVSYDNSFIIRSFKKRHH